MHIHLRVHRWVVSWFIVGIFLGAIAIINIVFRDLSRTQDRTILIVGALNWLLGGIVCYGYGGIRIQRLDQNGKTDHSSASVRNRRPQNEWHPASDFLLPGNHKHLLPPKY
jgi:hypothetical protein